VTTEEDRQTGSGDNSNTLSIWLPRKGEAYRLPW
jgi:hypothetical protein